MRNQEEKNTNNKLLEKGKMKYLTINKKRK